MDSITQIIQPIKLLANSHKETAQTGQGCFMNVIAYLNGEPQITDESPCVCEVVRPLAIWLNDYMIDTERQQLIPYIQRAMGSKTTDQKDISRRAWLAVDFANEMKEIAAAYSAAAYSAAHADAAAYSAAAAAHAAAAAVGVRQKIIAAGLKFLDSALPQADEISQCIIDRAQELVSVFNERATA